MPTNFLEQLVAEWYEYRGFFVRRNVKVGKRSAGGHEGELDVVAFHPVDKRLVHVETSMAADDWEEREAKFSRKFKAGKAYIPNLFAGLVWRDLRQTGDSTRMQSGTVFQSGCSPCGDSSSSPVWCG